MKKLIFCLVASITFGGLSFGQTKITINSVVEDSEYQSMDSNDQRLIDYINSAVGAVQSLEMNGKKYLLQDADIHFSKNEKDTFKNVIILTSDETDSTTSNKTAPGVRSCKVCGMGSAIKCVGAIRNANLGDDYNIHVHNDGGGCVTLSW